MQLFNLAILVICINSRSALAGELKFSSGVTQVPTLELYTSEGCSSCPPADRWFNGLVNQSGLFSEFIPLVFHVDYWNYLGWTDPLSSGTYATRQRSYAKSWKQKSVYTPGVVRKGLEWKSWRTTKNPGTGKHEEVGVLSAVGDRNRFSVKFTPVSQKKSSLEIHSAVLLMGFSSKVTSGENTGETLEHNFSVCSYSVSGLENQNSYYTGKISIEDCKNYPKERKALVFWVAKKGKPEPIQATGGLLE